MNRQFCLPSHLKILLIDDDQLILTLLSDQLTELYGAPDIITFNNPITALNFYAENHHEINLTIIDMIMPDMNGLELSKEIIKINPHEKIILMSAYSLPEMVNSEGSECIESFIPKTEIGNNDQSKAVLDYYVQKALIAKDHEVSVSNELHQLSLAVKQSINIIYVTNLSGIIEYVNPMFEQTTGYSSGEVIGKNAAILAPDYLPESGYNELLSSVIGGKIWRGVFKNRNKSGHTYWCNVVISPVIDDVGEVTHFLTVQEDITEKQESQKKIKELTAYDATTGLLNRTHFVQIVDDCLTRMATEGEKSSLMIIDIDDFILINKKYGHKLADTFLHQVGKLLQDIIAQYCKNRDNPEISSTAIARLGADEFAIILPNAELDETCQLARTINKTLLNYRHPLFDREAAETASIGISLYPEHAKNTAEILTKADTATFRAKELGGNQFYVFSETSGDATIFHVRRLWKDKIKEALEKDLFEPWFQPIMSLETNEVHHYEALVRMKNEDGTIIHPIDFLEAAERYKLIASIDRVMCEKAMRFQATHRMARPNLSISINLSGKELEDEDFLSFLKNTIEVTGANPGKIVFEITETEAVRDLEKAKEFIQALSLMGCKFSLDDFGVGFTSFLYLSEMEVDYIKIDGYFINNLIKSPNNQIFVKAIKDVAKGMGIKTIAEFVDNEATANILKEIGIDYIQGHLIGRASPNLLNSKKCRYY